MSGPAINLRAIRLGWDWFSLQLDDGSDLMLFKFAPRMAVAIPIRRGTFVDAEGDTTPLLIPTSPLSPLETWTSPNPAVATR